MQRMRVNPGRISVEEESELRRGPWTLEEDTLLTHYVSHHGEGRWNMLAKSAGLKRTGKSCRLRWLNYLKPDIKRGNLTPQEQLLILELHSKWGNRWSKIAQCLPGRTDNEIKNYWRTRVQKQARQLNIESNSKRFIDAVRCFWMPRLLQKMEQSSSSSSSPSQYNNYNYNNNNNIPQVSNNNYPTISPSSLISTNSLLPNSNNININSTHGNYSSDNPSDFTEVSQQQWQKTEVAVTENQSGPDDFRNDGHSNHSDQISNDMDGLSFNYLTDITSTAMEIDYYNVHSSSSECHMVDGDWASSYVGDALWNNLDDIWQLRE